MNNDLEQFDPSLYIGEKIVIDGEIFTVESIKGRWVRLSDGRNINRDKCEEGRTEYLEDLETLGDELEDEVESEDEPDDLTKSVIKKKYRQEYVISKTGDRKNIDNGDQVSIVLRGISPSEIIGLVNVHSPEHSGRWNHLNPGMRSMNGRNVLRRLVKKGALKVEDLVPSR